jgi:anthranilate/para-aminobenzoate synthase component II
MLLILDNKVSKTDRLSYSSNVIRVLKKYNIPYIRVDKVKDIDLNKIKGIIITGSGLKLSKISKKGDYFDYGFNLYYLTRLNVPVYGLCFGCQLLNILYGGTLVDNKKYICGDYELYKFKNQNNLFDNINTNKFNFCFSDIVIPKKNFGVKVFASIKYNNKLFDCGFVFEKDRVFGTLFHPEFYNETDRIYLNFYELCQKYVGCIK